MSATSDIEKTAAALEGDLHRVDANSLIDHWVNQLSGGSDKLTDSIVGELKNLRHLINGSEGTTVTVANSLQALAEMCNQVALHRHGFDIDAMRHLNQKLASAAGQIRAGF